MKLTLAGPVFVKGPYTELREYGTTGSVTDAKSQIWSPHKAFSYTHTYIYIIHAYVHTFHGSISVSCRQQDVEQVLNTRICRFTV